MQTRGLARIAVAALLGACGVETTKDPAGTSPSGPGTTTSPGTDTADTADPGDSGDSGDTTGPDHETSCRNGVDDDGDGLVDCEDADCWGLSSCAEDCTTTSDEDQDGRAGCGDADCWGTAACPSAEVQVLGADVRHARMSFNSSYGFRTYLDTYFYQPVFRSYIGTQEQLTFSDVSGLLRVPTTSGGHSTCAWSVGRARFEMNLFWSGAGDHELYFQQGVRSLVERSDVAFEPGCQLTSEQVLPVRLFGGDGAPMQTTHIHHAASQTFYPFTVQAMPIQSSTSWTRTYGNSTSFRHWDSRVFVPRSSVLGPGPVREVAPLVVE